ncbi:group II intron reverse transcriptase/maturase [Bacillus cereus]|nr:group II intron reverse transcriptase/maturase [Bacillus cereus]MBL3865091.1 group II intron reverse transcriptase/maturase [Bacillus cereus]
MNTSLRHWEYYGMHTVFDNLYKSSSENQSFRKLYRIIISEENILLAYRSIKSNKGSKTEGTDKFTIDNYKGMTKGEFIQFIRDDLTNYKPKAVRRKMIPKPNGEKRPLGIPCMKDRLIQQMFKQVLEPIAEAKFHKHSYGFRPIRSANHAIARCASLVNRYQLNYVVDIDIRGFFDNVNHTLLMKQLWNMGIKDRIVLKIIMKMLKAPIKGEGLPSKGTPQGGILSPLLSNIVLNDLDQWVYSQWEGFKTKREYSGDNKKNRALKTTNLKEGYIVRYADDFKIFARDWKTAQKWYHAVRLYLKERLKLDISLEKSKVIKLRKDYSEFLGFKICAKVKGRNNKGRLKYVMQTNIKNKKKQEIKSKVKKKIKKIQKEPIAENILNLNQYIAGIQNYFKYATNVFRELKDVSYKLSTLMYNRLKDISKKKYPLNANQTYKKRYSLTYKTWEIAGVYIYPLHDINYVVTRLLPNKYNVYTIEGRAAIDKNLDMMVNSQLEVLRKSLTLNNSIEFYDNRLSRYSMKKGRCEITERFLYAYEVHCHHYIPLHLGGDDSYNNLRIIHVDIHKLIHATRLETIEKYMKEWSLNDEMVRKINQYRKKCNLKAITMN